MKASTVIDFGVRGAEYSLATRIGSALLVGLLGLALVGITAFAPLPNIHNAAHDSRHSFAAPCH